MTEANNLRLIDLLAATAQELVGNLDADACTVSRAIGDVLILVTEHAPDGTSLLMGQGYLVPDYPLTQIVLSSGRPVSLTLADDGVDPAEAGVLQELGFASLLMLPLLIGGDTWGLVEVYRIATTGFSPDDQRVAEEILARAAARVG
jgi:GAF domain-containing protein